MVPDFRIEDVWELPARGGRDDFHRLVAMAVSQDPSRSSSRAVRALFAVRWKLGELLGWDPSESPAQSLRDRLPAELRHTAAPPFEALPFTSLYRLDDEFAAEVTNRTIHGVLHLGWVPDGPDTFRGQMAVIVKPNGAFGTAYMSAIRLFRHAIVYPALIGQWERAWQTPPGDPARSRQPLRTPPASPSAPRPAKP